MMPSLSDQTKSFFAFCAVLVVVLCNVVFGQDWTVGSGTPTKMSTATPAAGNVPVAPLAPIPVAPAQNFVPPPGNGQGASVQTGAPMAAAPAEAVSPPCDVEACTRAYRTFRASDCTYIPSFGVRKLCTKGTPPQ
jgi:hypothetical protein